MPPHLITIGEILVEIMRPRDGQPLDQAGTFLGPFASGAPAIAAVAAARLGLATAFIGAVGDDAFGRLLRARLSQEGVDTDQLQTAPGYTTGIAFIAYRPDGSREFVFHLRRSAAVAIDPGRIHPDLFAHVRWFHLSGSALALGEASRAACRRALDLTGAAGGRFSFDPNLRPELMGLDDARRIFAPFIDAADLLLPSAEEARLLTGEADDERAARALRGQRERPVIVKRGAGGCALLAGDTWRELPGFPVEEIDPTGAGDCFDAACLAGLEAGWPLERVVRFANAAGALSVTRQGPMEGAPRRAEIERLL